MKKIAKAFSSLSLLALLLSGCDFLEVHTVNFNSMGGSPVESQNVPHGEKATKPDDPILEGHSFSYWSHPSNHNKSYDFSSPVTESMTLFAHYDPNYYNLTLNNSDPKKGTLLGEGSYAYGSTVTVTASPNLGYFFDGWFDEGVRVSRELTYSFEMGFDTTLAGMWEANWYSLHVYPYLGGEESKAEIISGISNPKFGEEVTVKATSGYGYIFLGWYNVSSYLKEEEFLSDEETYTFIMPPGDLTLKALFKDQRGWDIKHGVIPTETNGFYYSSTNVCRRAVTYGLYPQTHVNNSQIIEKLEELESPILNDWYFYNDDYYAKVVASPYYDGFHIIRRFSDGTIIEYGETYWFKCEPIKWYVMSNDSVGGDIPHEVISASILEPHVYHSSTELRNIDGQTVYPNNYKYSDIRAWLNEEFFNTAFALENSRVLLGNVDNDTTLTDAIYGDNQPYLCEDTEDKVYLPSYSQFGALYGSDGAAEVDDPRFSLPTDYAKAKGADSATNTSFLDYTMFWTRSTSGDSFNVDGDSVIISGSGCLYARKIVNQDGIAVRPAIALKYDLNEAIEATLWGYPKY